MLRSTQRAAQNQINPSVVGPRKEKLPPNTTMFLHKLLSTFKSTIIVSCSSPFPPLQKAKCFCLFLVCHTNHSRFEKSSDQTPIDVNKSSFEVFQIYHNRKLLQPFSSFFNKRPAALKFVTSSENWRLQKSRHQIANKLEHK